MKCVKQNSPREWQIGADLTANKPISEIFHAFCSVGGWGVEESRGREVGGTGGKRRGREEGRPILRVGCGAERWMAIFSFSPSSLLLFLTLSGSRLQQSLLWRLEKSARSTQVWLSSKDAPLCSDQPIWLHTRRHKENDGPVVIFAQLPSSLFISIICLPPLLSWSIKLYRHSSASVWLNSGAPGPPTSLQVRGHMQVSPQRAVIHLCGPVLPLLSLSVWLLLCSDWAYRRANSGVLSSPFLPPLSHSLSLSRSLTVSCLSCLHWQLH